MNADETRALVARANDRLARGAWQEARDAFEAVRGLTEDPEALEGLGMAAWWLDDATTVFEARERAYRLYRRRGDRRGAARVATAIAMDCFHFRGQTSVARGWQRRAARLLEDFPVTPEHAWLRLWECEVALATGQDPARVCEVAAEAVATSRAVGDPGAETLALSLEGLARVMQGAVDEGMRQLEEAATAALSGELTNPLAIGISCCHLVTACEAVRDFGRAAEWCERVREFSTRISWRVLSSVCRIQHAAVLLWSGSSSEAEEELEQAIRHLAAVRPSMQEQALVLLAELRRRQGRLEEADALLERVDWHPHGRLVRAAVALARGKPAAAAEQARRILEQASLASKVDRALAGELLLRAELALGCTPTAAARDEIEQLAEWVGTGPLRASARIARGLIAEAGGDHERARAAFEDAIALFAHAGARYETARARVDLARTLLALSRAEEAGAELHRAARVFEEIGAAGDLRTVQALRARASGRPGGQAMARPGGLSAREVDVLRLMAEGLSNAQIARRLVVSEFTVKRHVANILTKLDVPTRAAAAVYAARERWI